MSRRLDALRSQFSEARDGIDAIEADPKGENGDLSEEQQTQSDTLLARCEELTPEIETLAKREKSLAATANVLASLPSMQRATPTAKTKEADPAIEMSAGEYFSLFARATAGDEDAQQILRADTITDDVTGILPTPIVGQVIKLADDSRPVFSSLTSRPMPEKGKTFDRPRITQRVAVGEQAVEKTAIATQSLTATGDPVTKRTFAGTLDISQQAIDWTDPALLDIALADFVGVYANVTEGEACDFLEGLVDTSALGDTNSVTWTGTDPGTIVASITSAVQNVYANSKRLPDTFWLGLDVAMEIAGTTNTDDTVTAISLVRRALQDVGLSLNFVIGPQFAADTRIVGNRGLLESYERRKGILQAINVPLLGLDVAYSGYIAFYTPKLVGNEGGATEYGPAVTFLV